MNHFGLSKAWFDWTFENTHKVRTKHTALYFYILDRSNRLGWKDVFGLPTDMTMEALGIKNWRTYINTFDDLEKFGFIKIIERSKNQYTCNTVAIVKNTKATTKAHTKALSYQVQKQSRSIDNSIVDIDKPKNLITLEPNNLRTEEENFSPKKEFEDFPFYNPDDTITDAMAALNETLGTRFSPLSLTVECKSNVLAILDHYSLDDIRAVCHLQKSLSEQTDHRGQYRFNPEWLTPKTLFTPAKFEKYYQHAQRIHNGDTTIDHKTDTERIADIAIAQGYTA